MYKSNSDLLVQAFSNKELKTLVMALAAYNKLDKRETRTDLMEKLINGFLHSNDLEAEVIENVEAIERTARKNPYDKSIPKQYWGTANGKAYLAELEEADTEAHSY
jgi:DNA-binding IclR family transcriptional regulator